MQFFAMARNYRRPEDAISLRDVWTIGDRELNEAAGIACGRLRDEKELAALHGCESRMAVMASAWFIEFRQRLPWLLHVD